MRLECQNIAKDYHLQRALAEISFSIENHNVMGVVGPNGAGKTTLIKIIARLIKPSEGKIFVDGEDMKGMDRGRLGLISLNSYLYSDLTVSENLDLYAKLYKADAGSRKKFAEYFNLTGMLDKPMRELSHGQKQRASLARAMLGNPDIMLLDEPFLGLDIEATEELVDLIVELKSQGKIVILATHHLDIASKIINKVMILKEGRAIHLGSFDDSKGPLAGFYREHLERNK